jgi:hypothetical protein
MVSNKNNKHSNNKNVVEISKYIKYGAILLLIILIAVAIYFSVKVATMDRSKKQQNSSYQPKIFKSAGRINGSWAGTIGCGDGTFNLISLASALPQDLNSNSLDNFLGKVMGIYNSKLSDGTTKYIISIGGSNASPEGWTSFFNLLTDNNNSLVPTFVAGLKCRGIVGIDLDLEKTTEAMIPSIISIVNSIKALDSNFIVMYTILLGSPDTFAGLLNTSNYDYLSLMLYNGGMYIANVSGDGCDWDGWAELILSKGTAGCKTPLNGDLSQYVNAANLAKVDPSKVLLGLIIDTDKLKLNADILARANQLIGQYGGAGTMIWLIPGWANPNSISDLNALGFNIDASKCKGGGNTCPPPEKPCVTGSKCIASPCGKSVQSVTDDQCAVCSTGATYWPCGSLNFCQLDDGTKPQTCTY